MYLKEQHYARECELYSPVKSILVLVKHVAQIHVRVISVFFVPLLEQFLALFVAFIPIDVHIVSRENAFALSSFRYVFSRKELDFVFFSLISFLFLGWLCREDQSICLVSLGLFLLMYLLLLFLLD